jgi:hypothetical protein
MTISLNDALSKAHATAVLMPDRAAHPEGLVGLRHPVKVPSQPRAVLAALVMCREIIMHEPGWRALRETRCDRRASHRQLHKERAHFFNQLISSPLLACFRFRNEALMLFWQKRQVCPRAKRWVEQPQDLDQVFERSSPSRQGYGCSRWTSYRFKSRLDCVG